jgi:potassium-dependent mechanosensitive channel
MTRMFFSLAGCALFSNRSRLPVRLALHLCLCIGLALLLPRAEALAQSASPAAAKVTLDTARNEIAAIQKEISSSENDRDLSRQRAAALKLRADGEAAINNLAPALASVQVRLGQLGQAAAGSREAPDVAAERAELERSRNQLDAQIKLARLLIVEAEQAAAQIATRRRQQFQASLGERTASILGSTFWSEVREDLPRDAARVAALGREVRAAVSDAPTWLLIAVPAALALIAAVRWWLGNLLLRLTATRVPPSRLRRTLHAVTIVALAVATAALVVSVLGLLFSPRPQTRAPLSDALAALAPTFASAVCFGAYIAGLGRALLSPGQPSWRLSTLPDRVAIGLRWFPPQLATLIVLVIMIETLAPLLDTSLATTVAINCIMQLAIGASMALAILRSERLRREAADSADQAASAHRPAWLLALIAAGWLVLAGSLVCLLAGYVAFGSFVVKQVAWTAVVLGSAYLLAVLVDDVFNALLTARAAASADGAGKDAATAPANEVRLGAQAAVLLSGLSRLLIALVAMMLLLAPFGEGPADLFGRTNQWRDSLEVGQISISPGAVMQALLVLGLSLLAVRVLRQWLLGTYLPTTRLDAGMRTSATTLIGYLGYIAAVSLSLSAAGLGLERVAWVASALSVGIGFGLQAVVQNFVSGLILLAERPVKVGDWVSLGAVEGDIQRINMRATEIQLGDRSTVIVPNSEFITKTVRNVTHENPLGLVQIKLPMPLTTQAGEVRTLLLGVFGAHPDVLPSPAPNVQLDGIDNGNLVFNATGYVVSPRAAYGVRSALLFSALEALAKAGIELSRPPQLIAMPPSPQNASTPATSVASVPKTDSRGPLGISA